MANKTTANAFMASAQKSKREMADIQKEGSGKHETDEVELKKISLLIPAWLHKEAQLHRVETGESMTKLIVRLLAEELGYRSIQDAADDVQRSRASLSSAIKKSGTCAGCHWALV